MAESTATPWAVPVSTYRLQVTAADDLHRAAGRLAYLHDLGVDWVYLSPLLAAEPGSDHGYDVVAHTHVDVSRGGAEGLAAVSAEAHRLGMGVLVDIVPNHVGVATPPKTAWWWELLRDGPGSVAANRFDVDWVAGGGRVLVPVVGDDDLLEDGGIAHLETGQGPSGFPELSYHDHRYPVASRTEGGTADEVHARQHYELAGWRRADLELNYRRFFTVNTLAAIRVEDPDVFAESHVEIGRWFREGLVDGLRVDHPDGLRDPQGYLDDLAALTDGAYVLVEKILEPGERLDPSWACAGTTGYDALALIDRVLTDPAGQEPLTALDSRLRGEPLDWERLVHDRKRDVADVALGAETRRVVRELPGLDVDPDALVDAVAELLACFPVYRSYLPAGVEHLDEALTLARGHRPDLAAALDALAPVLHDPDQDAALRLQQTSGMVMAKGVEDCSFYRYSRLTSLNEVGGDPSLFSVSPEDFHAFAARRQREWPHAMTCLTTHDTKRSEDVRARITVLAEAPQLWAEALEALLALAPVPDPGFANLLWQATVGAWPIERERLHAYAEKAMREAGDRTTWTAPDEEYERAVHAAVDAAHDDPAVTAVLDRVLQRVTDAGRDNALVAKLLALTMPGVPDVYQGTEREDLSLVDPDNRRPVDFEDTAATLADGSVLKQHVTATALRLRRDRPELFTTYEPLLAQGGAAGHVLAFDRGGALTVLTRLPLGLRAAGGWGDTEIRLPAGAWTDQVAGGRFSGAARLADLLQHACVALLVREGDA